MLTARLSKKQSWSCYQHAKQVWALLKMEKVFSGYNVHFS